MRMPKPAARASARYWVRFCLHSCTTAGSIGPLCAGTLKFGVRWNTVRCAAWAAICGIAWIADEPVPITPTAGR